MIDLSSFSSSGNGFGYGNFIGDNYLAILQTKNGSSNNIQISVFSIIDKMFLPDAIIDDFFYASSMSSTFCSPYGSNKLFVLSR